MPRRDYEIGVDSSRGVAGVRDFASAAQQSLSQVDSAFDQSKSRGQQLADGLSAMATELDAEFDRAVQAADRLGQALGPELRAQLGNAGVDQLVQDLRRAGLSFDDIEADADRLAASIRQLNATGIRIDTRDVGPSLRGLDTDLTRVRRSGDQTRSVLANMVGNAAQDMGALAGVAGTAGVAIGQAAEYATDGNVSLRNMAMAAGPLVALGGAIAFVSDHLADIAATEAFERGRVDAFVGALEDARVTASELQDVLNQDQASGIFVRMANETRNVDRSVGQLFDTFEEFNGVVRGGETAYDTWASAQLRAAAAAGATESEIRNLATVMQDAKSSTLLGHEAIETLNAGYGSTVDTAFALAQAIRQGGAAVDEAGFRTQFYGDAATDAASATGELTDAQQQAKEAADAQAGALEELASILEGMSEAGRTAADTQRAAAESGQAWFETIAGYSAAVEEAAGDQSKLNDVVNSGVESAISYADATVAAYDAQATANGAALDGAAKISLFNQKMIEAAGSASGPLRDSILSYVQTANQIPPEKLTEIRAMIEAGDLAGAVSALDAASETREAAIKAQEVGAAAAAANLDQAAMDRDAVMTAVALTGQAEGGLNATSRPRNAPITGVGSFANAEGQANTTARPRTAPITGAPNFANAESVANNTARARQALITASANTGAAEAALNDAARARSTTITVGYRVVGGVPVPGARARAGFIPPGHTDVVGEAGGEWVDRPTLVRGPATVRRALNAPGRGGDTVNNYVTVNMPAGSRPADVMAAQRRWHRRHGPS